MPVSVFTPLKDWKERSKDQSADAVAGKAFGAFSQIKDAIVFPLNPPPIPELGNATGFTFRLQDRAGVGHDALVQARNQILGMAAQSKVLAGVRPEGLEDAPQLVLNIDRDKANALGLTFAGINSVLSTALGSSYVNDFPNQGRQQRVIVQADSRPPSATGRSGPFVCAQYARHHGSVLGLHDVEVEYRSGAIDSLQRLSGNETRRWRSPGPQYG